MCRTASPSRSLPRCWRCLPVRLGWDASGSSCSGSTTPAGTLSRTWLFRTGSGSSTCPHTPPSFSPPSTSGPFWMSHSPTTTSGHLLSSSTSSPRAVAFSIAISSNSGQASTGGPSQTSRPNQPETVSLGRYEDHALRAAQSQAHEVGRKQDHASKPDEGGGNGDTRELMGNGDVDPNREHNQVGL